MPQTSPAAAVPLLALAHGGVVGRGFRHDVCRSKRTAQGNGQSQNGALDETPHDSLFLALQQAAVQPRQVVTVLPGDWLQDVSGDGRLILFSLLSCEFGRRGGAEDFESCLGSPENGQNCTSLEKRLHSSAAAIMESACRSVFLTAACSQGTHGQSQRFPGVICG